MKTGMISLNASEVEHLISGLYLLIYNKSCSMNERVTYLNLISRLEILKDKLK
jgi:hypothetical protein